MAGANLVFHLNQLESAERPNGVCADPAHDDASGEQARRPNRIIRRRNAAGQFTKGNKGGPGRPPRQTERSCLAAMSEACPPETWREIVQRAVEDATGGDARAWEWLSSYLLGAPTATATTPHRLAVEDEAGTDHLTDEIKLERPMRQ